MNITAQFIADRIQTLLFEVRQNIQTIDVTERWMELAKVWAYKHGFAELAEDLESALLWLSSVRPDPYADCPF